MNQQVFTDIDWWIQLPKVLAHFVWQAALILLIAALLLRKLQQSRAQVRYLVLLVCLGGLFLAPLATTGWLLSSEGIATSVDRQLQGATVAGENQRVVGTLSEPSSRDVLGKSPGAMGEVSPLDRPKGAVAFNHWPGWITTLYLMGVVLMMLRLALSLLSARSLQKGALEIQEPALLKVLERQVRRVGLMRHPIIRMSERIQVPTIVGVFRPTILLPCQLLARLSREQLAAVFIHELIHLRRLDPVVNLLQRFVEVLFFFHPAVWILSGWIKQEREMSCDEAVVALGESATDYAETLVQVAKWSVDLPVQQSLLALHAARPGATLDLRVRRLLGMSQQPRLWPSWSHALGLTGLVLLAICSLVSVSADPNPSENESVEAQETNGPPARFKAVLKDLRVDASALDLKSRQVVRPLLPVEDYIRYTGPLILSCEVISGRIMRQWSRETQKGDFFLDWKIGGIEALRGTRVAKLEVASWDAVEALTNEEIQSVIDQEEQADLVWAGPSFVAVWTPENLMAVLHIQYREDRSAELEVEIRKPAQVRGPTRPRHFVRVVAGPDGLTYEGKETSWAGLREQLSNSAIPREQTVLQLGVSIHAPEDWDFSEARDEAFRLWVAHGFEYLSLVGNHDPGSSGDATQMVPFDPAQEARLATLIERLSGKAPQNLIRIVMHDESSFMIDDVHLSGTELVRVLRTLPHRERTGLALYPMARVGALGLWHDMEKQLELIGDTMGFRSSEVVRRSDLPETTKPLKTTESQAKDTLEKGLFQEVARFQFVPTSVGAMPSTSLASGVTLATFEPDAAGVARFVFSLVMQQNPIQLDDIRLRAVDQDGNALGELQTSKVAASGTSSQILTFVGRYPGNQDIDQLIVERR